MQTFSASTPLPNKHNHPSTTLCACLCVQTREGELCKWPAGARVALTIALGWLACVCSVLKNRPEGERESAILGSIMFTHLHFEERIWRQYLIAVFVTGVYRSCFEAWIIFHLFCVGPCFLAAVEKYMSSNAFSQNSTLVEKGNYFTCILISQFLL